MCIRDRYGTIAEKIISIAKFRIPYYVGPLSRRHKGEGSNSWIDVYKRQILHTIYYAKWKKNIQNKRISGCIAGT